jgi:CubicO group peptidase (beta-lactamase class C family)
MRVQQRLFSVMASFGLGLALLQLMANISFADSALLPERVREIAQQRADDGTYQTLIFGVVADGKSEVIPFGNLSDGTPPDGDTVYEIGSITKTFTATLLADAVLSKSCTLDTPVAALLPEFKIPERNGKKITLGEIGTQYSGLPRLPSNLKPQDPANPYADYNVEKLKAFLAGYQLERDPGESFEYSNLAFGLLGYALAQAVHTTYWELVNEKILQPLGMTMSGTEFTKAMRAHLALGHDEMGVDAKNWDMNVLVGAGGIRSTANDMLRYLKANLGVDQTPLTAAMKYAQQSRRAMTDNMRMGLAWITTGKGVTWHNGGTDGYRAFLGFTADRHKGVIILTNTATDVDDLGFATLLDDAPLAPAQKAIELPATALNEYLGTYQFGGQLEVKVFLTGNQLYAQGTGEQAFPIFPSASDEFFAKVGLIRISFTRDDNGGVAGMVIHQHGDHTLPKLGVTGAAPEPKETALSPAKLQDYVGQYQFSFGAVLAITVKDAQLQAQFTGQPAAPIYASAADKFFYKIVDAQLDFERDKSGKVVAVMLHQNDQNLRAPRKAQ